MYILLDNFLVRVLDDVKPETCALCLEAKKIRKSHIIPKFFGDWIKRTSATGYLVSATNASKRKQDIVKIPLLCDRCEERLSKYESWFALNIFKPFEKTESFDRPQSFEYDANLELFITSLSWRALKLSYDEAKADRPDLVPLIDEAERCWREFLLGKRRTIPYESHLLFVGSGVHDVDSLGGSDWYRFRTVDATLCTSANRVFSYVKLPHMLTATAIYPSNMEGWEGTLTKTSGKISTFQSIGDEGFKKFFANRAQQAITISPQLSVEMSTKRMKKALEDDPLRVLKSETTKIMWREMDEDLRKKTADMPENVRDLVEVIVGAVDNPDTSNEYNQSAYWAGRHIANKLANLSSDDINELDRAIEAVLESGTTGKYARSVWKARSVWIVVMVNHNATKELQHSKMRDVFKSLQSQQGSTKTPIGVFSINRENGGCSFESGFYV